MNHSTAKPQTVMVDDVTYHSIMNHSTTNPQAVMVDDVAYHSIMNHSTPKPQTVMVNNTIYNQQYHEPLHCQTLNSNGGQYNI
jgi:hypothetical protein